MLCVKLGLLKIIQNHKTRMIPITTLIILLFNINNIVVCGLVLFFCDWHPLGGQVMWLERTSTSLWTSWRPQTTLREQQNPRYPNRSCFPRTILIHIIYLYIYILLYSGYKRSNDMGWDNQSVKWLALTGTEQAQCKITDALKTFSFLYK